MFPKTSPNVVPITGKKRLDLYLLHFALTYNKYRYGETRSPLTFQANGA
jgi:hypothetical protein